ncbi:MAG: periplasmic heavy metal sensor [Caulobacteraceae bacterium]
MSLWRSLALTLVLSIIAAAAGVAGGERFVLARARQGADLHELLHDRLRLSPDQRRRIGGLERSHAERERGLAAQMRAANADLARAYREDRAYTPKVAAAVDRLHEIMGASQKETMAHVIAMRSVLRPDQTALFDRMIIGSLTKSGS